MIWLTFLHNAKSILFDLKKYSHLKCQIGLWNSNWYYFWEQFLNLRDKSLGYIVFEYAPEMIFSLWENEAGILLCEFEVHSILNKIAILFFSKSEVFRIKNFDKCYLAKEG